MSNDLMVTTNSAAFTSAASGGIITKDEWLSLPVTYSTFGEYLQSHQGDIVEYICYERGHYRHH